MTESRGERGFLLPLLLLALLVLTGIAQAVLVAARLQRFTADGQAGSLRAGAAARSVSVHWLSTVEASDLPSTLGTEGFFEHILAVPEGGSATLRIVELAPEWLWLEGRAREGRVGAMSESVVGSLAWTLSPARRVASVRATIEAGGAVDVAPSGSLESFDSRPPVTAIGKETLDARGVPRLGLLDADALGRRRSSSGPADPETEPAARILVIKEPSAVVSDPVRGVLVAEGDLTLAVGTRVEGAVLAGGSLVVEAGALLRGHARVAGDVHVREDGAAVGDPEILLQVLEELPILSIPLPANGVPWVSIP